MYAVIRSGGKQYRVSEGDLVQIEDLGREEGGEVEFNEILLVRTDDKTLVGQPLVQGASVMGVVRERGKGDTVLVFKYKKKKQYRRTLGHRQPYSSVQIQKISAPA